MKSSTLANVCLALVGSLALTLAIWPQGATAYPEVYRRQLQMIFTRWPDIWQDVRMGRLVPLNNNMGFNQGMIPNQQGFNQQGLNQQGLIPNQQGFNQGIIPNQQGLNQQGLNQQGLIPNQQGLIPNQQGLIPNQQGLNQQGLIPNQQGINQGVIPNQQTITPQNG